MVAWHHRLNGHVCVCVCFSGSTVSDSWRPHRLQPTRLLCPWDSPGKNTGVDCHSFLQRIFQTQGSNPGLWHCRHIFYLLGYREVLNGHEFEQTPREWRTGEPGMLQSMGSQSRSRLSNWTTTLVLVHSSGSVLSWRHSCIVLINFPLSFKPFVSGVRHEAPRSVISLWRHLAPQSEMTRLRSPTSALCLFPWSNLVPVSLRFSVKTQEFRGGSQGTPAWSPLRLVQSG